MFNSKESVKAKILLKKTDPEEATGTRPVKISNVLVNLYHRK